MKKLSLEQMETVEGGWPKWAGGSYSNPTSCIEYTMPDGTTAHEYWGTQDCLWGLISSDYQMLESGVGPC